MKKVNRFCTSFFRDNVLAVYYNKNVRGRKPKRKGCVL